MNSTPTPIDSQPVLQKISTREKKSPLGRIEKVDPGPRTNPHLETLRSCVRLHAACSAALTETLFGDPADGDAEPAGARESRAKLILSALEVSQLCADFLIRRSAHVELTCKLCADVCRSLLEYHRDSLAGHPLLAGPLRHCAEACERYARNVAYAQRISA